MSLLTEGKNMAQNKEAKNQTEQAKETTKGDL
jgi:hypothetical protein